MKIRTWIIIIIIIVAAILVGARVRSISTTQNKEEAAETRLTLEAMAQQDTAAIQEEIELKRTVTDTIEGDVGDAAQGEEQTQEEAEPEEDAQEEDAQEEEDEEETTAEEDETVEVVDDRVTFSDTQMPPLEELQSYNYKEIFSNCVVMGDSIASGLSSYDILSDSETVTKIGELTFEAARDHLGSAAAMNPKVLFVAYGLNDAASFVEDVDNFKQTYEDFLTSAQEMMPNTKIYSILILPVQEKAIENHPGFRYIDAYNQAIIEACEDHGIDYMDLGFTALEQYFDTDGLHMYPDFYYGWAYYMAKGAGLL